MVPEPEMPSKLSQYLKLLPNPHPYLHPKMILKFSKRLNKKWDSA